MRPGERCCWSWSRPTADPPSTGSTLRRCLIPPSRGGKIQSSGPGIPPGLLPSRYTTPGLDPAPEAWIFPPLKQGRRLPRDGRKLAAYAVENVNTARPSGSSVLVCVGCQRRVRRRTRRVPSRARRGCRSGGEDLVRAPAVCQARRRSGVINHGATPDVIGRVMG